MLGVLRFVVGCEAGAHVACSGTADRTALRAVGVEEMGAIQPPLFLGSERQKNWDVLDTGVYTDTLVAEGALKKNQQQPMAYPERARANRAAGETLPVRRPAQIKSKNGKRAP